jgi:hypothetical protein
VSASRSVTSPPTDAHHPARTWRRAGPIGCKGPIQRHNRVPVRCETLADMISQKPGRAGHKNPRHAGSDLQDAELPKDRVHAVRVVNEAHVLAQFDRAGARKVDGDLLDDSAGAGRHDDDPVG